MRNRNTIEYLGLWETLYNPNFKPLEFEEFRKQAGLNAFTLSPQKWIGATNAVGIICKSGRYGGTFAYKDIAFKFAAWISIEFELYVAKEFQRLKTIRSILSRNPYFRNMLPIGNPVPDHTFHVCVRKTTIFNELTCCIERARSLPSHRWGSSPLFRWKGQ